MSDLLHDKLAVVNVGLEMFVASVERGGAPVVNLDWRPAGDGEPRLAWALAELTGDPADPDAPGSRVDAANKTPPSNACSPRAPCSSTLRCARTSLAGVVGEREEDAHARRRADPVGADVRPDEGHDDRRDALRGLGEER